MRQQHQQQVLVRLLRKKTKLLTKGQLEKAAPECRPAGRGDGRAVYLQRRRQVFWAAPAAKLCVGADHPALSHAHAMLRWAAAQDGAQAGDLSCPPLPT